MDGIPTTDGNSNVFLRSLQQLGQYLAQQNQGTGSGIGLGSGGAPQGPAFNLASGVQPSKIVTQVHYPTPETSTDQANAQPAVSSPPPAPQVSTFSPPQGGAQAIARPGGVSVPQTGGAQGGGQTAAQPGASAAPAQSGAIDNLGTLGDEALANEAISSGGAAGGANPASNAISGITSALSKGLGQAASAIGGVNTMPTPVQSGPFPSINQYAPTLIGRRTQPVRPYA